MTTNLIPFVHESAELRAILIDGEPWFVAGDVARMLGYRDAYNMARRLDDDEKGTHSLSTPGGTQLVGIINESGLYAAILGSQVEGAQRFKRWITREVLPSIRRTGQYGIPELDLSDPIAAIEAAHAQAGQAIEVAKAERARAEKAERQVEIEQRHRRAIEGGDGILLTDFGKKYFSEVRHTDFFEHLYAKKWLIDQRGTRINAHGEVRDGHDHRKPTYKGRPYIYEHDTGTHGGQRRFQSRVRPQREIELRDALASEGLPVNTHSTGLVLITNDELKGLGAGVAS